MMTPGSSVVRARQDARMSTISLGPRGNAVIVQGRMLAVSLVSGVSAMRALEAMACPWTVGSQTVTDSPVKRLCSDAGRKSARGAVKSSVRAAKGNGAADGVLADRRFFVPREEAEARGTSPHTRNRDCR